MSEEKEWTGLLTYENHANDYFFEFALLNGKSLSEMLDEYFDRHDWRYCDRKITLTIKEFDESV